jgi:hypothetical protein
VAIVQDRYDGVYSGGAWLAIGNANDSHVGGQNRVDWAIGNGPSGDDLTAALFWQEAPSWIVAAETADGALQKLIDRCA